MDRIERGKQHLRDSLLAGAGSSPTEPVDGQYFKSLRAKVYQWQEENRKTISAYNEYVEAHGLFSDDLRIF
ncbi:TPA: type II toxin-antitoxin system CcdA family antitoxin [Pseudomonas aeruginosa]|nr:type II toxin-antitoxin system CcdA family antitoxin [Pseudomonas aeruginosa]HCJ6265395.1 type II toxin-antitoxin system CcdA family antitoxin [Pseudomonas aeruginosa]